MIVNQSTYSFFQSNIGRLLFIIVGAVLIAAGVTLVPEENASAILAALLIFLLLSLVLRPLKAQKGTQSLYYVILISLVIHLTATLILDPFSATLEADALNYMRHGWLIADSWRHGTWITYENAAPFVIAPGYTYLNAIIYYFGGFNPILVKLLNATIGAMLALPLYFLSRQFFTHRVSILASILVAFTPSMIFWSTQNLKDTLVVFFAILALYLVVSIGRAKNSGTFIGKVILLILSLIYLYFLRAPAAAFLLVWIVFQTILQGVKGRSLGRFTVAILLSGLLLLIVWQVDPIRDLTENAIKNSINLDDLDRFRSYRVIGGSAFGRNIAINSFEDLIRYIPGFIVAYLLRPFPWEVSDSLFQWMTIPEMFVWYGLFAASIVGILLLLKRDWFTYFLIWVYPVSVVLISAPQYGNLGTSYRHRSQVLPFFFILASVAIVYMIQKKNPFREYGEEVPADS